VGWECVGDAGEVPDEIGVPVVEVTADVGDDFLPVPVVGEATASTGLLDVADGGLRVRPVHVTFPACCCGPCPGTPARRLSRGWSRPAWSPSCPRIIQPKPP
jgi:hypothetical protein